ncbi:hypothetical protein AQUCO_02000229v1 [Aquilegia coerulea]|uniref:F-box domain-containing protein n=1 Tax=Aquilegia coerulea TaxID=218851 RepID=A0A2G5DHD2_AQUCA|nr:hypothetical protein AQUCO_02000229v1 [Aquilegia coerulea]
MESVNAKEMRNWLDLPQDVMDLIFMKLGAIDLIFRAQRVCSPWRKLAKQPQFFRCIDLRNPWRGLSDPGDAAYDPGSYFEFEELAKEALSRCNGDLEEFSIEFFCTNELVYHIIHQSPFSLRCFRLVDCYQVSDYVLIKLLENNPFLEEIVLSCCCFTEETIETLALSCPLLKSFRLEYEGEKHLESDIDEDEFNREAYAVANNMPELLSLSLVGNKITNDGLEAILDGCPHLEYLDLRQCFCLDLKGNLLKRCVDDIKVLKLPNDSTDD